MPSRPNVPYGLSAPTGEVVKALGVINGPCSEAPAIAHDDAGNFMTVSAREGYPNPWGWPGPGAVLCSRVMADGSTPEANLKYGPKLSFICLRSVPNVVDGATWGKTSKSWDSGAVGGFPGTADGLWPNGWPTVAYDGRSAYLFAWVKGTNGLRMVVLMGGEPGLCREETLALAERTRGLAVGVRIETNGYWATDEEAATQFLQPFSRCGASVMFSLDAWHERFVPPDRVILAMRTMKALRGEMCVESAPCRRRPGGQQAEAVTWIGGLSSVWP